MTTFSVSAVVLLGILLVVFIRGGKISIGYAILAALFGFFVAKTSAAQPIQQFLDSIANTVNQITH